MLVAQNGPEVNVKTISVRLDESTYGLLVEESEKTGIPPSVLARAYIRAEVTHDIRPPLVAGSRISRQKKRKKGR